MLGLTQLLLAAILAVAGPRAVSIPCGSVQSRAYATWREANGHIQPVGSVDNANRPVSAVESTVGAAKTNMNFGPGNTAAVSETFASCVSNTRQAGADMTLVTIRSNVASRCGVAQQSGLGGDGPKWNADVLLPPSVSGRWAVKLNAFIDRRYASTRAPVPVAAYGRCTLRINALARTSAPGLTTDSLSTVVNANTAAHLAVDCEDTPTPGVGCWLQPGAVTSFASKVALLATIEPAP